MIFKISVDSCKLALNLVAGNSGKMSSRRRVQSGDERDKLGMGVGGEGGQQQDNGLEVEQEEDGQVTANGRNPNERQNQRRTRK